ncbi:MAG TPA: hypothetical protein VK808_05535 [Bacteroidia bacterium]|jgi:hypothetical protein|nr:hypothetical protein [Bacteroidia bacterium]
MKTYSYFITVALLFFCCSNAFCQWTYDKKVDAMTDKTTYFAFNKGAEGELELLNKEDDNEVIFSVAKGHFDVYEGWNCRVTIRFDKQPAFTFESRNNVVDKNFLLFSEPDIINKIKAAKTMLVEVEYYNNKKHLFKFNVSGLKWEH